MVTKIDCVNLDQKVTGGATSEYIETMKKVIDGNGLGGFFNSKPSPNPDGVALDYDVEQYKRDRESWIK